MSIMKLKLSTAFYLLICLFYGPMCADYIFDATQPLPELQRCPCNPKVPLSLVSFIHILRKLYILDGCGRFAESIQLPTAGKSLRMLGISAIAASLLQRKSDPEEFQACLEPTSIILFIVQARAERQISGAT